MSEIIEKTKNELTGLQYSLDQIQLNKINVDLLFISNTPYTRGLIENSERYFDSRVQTQKEWEKKVTEAAGLEYDETQPFDRQRIYEILGDEMDETITPENQESIHSSEEVEIESLLSHIGEIKELDQKINDQLDHYLELFPATQQIDFHFMLDALQNFVEWADDYSTKIKSFKRGNISEKEMEEFKISSEFVSLCCNWLSSTVSTVLKYGFGGSESETI
ncbi:hypothetical protein [Rhodohalobacter sp. 614A]|uniref:hypothetical protein n=1 Tax=Rhodohalobacter sp. 614A TaxID=2908649 RepID=UPI001F289B8A|nr:hypothetical protein [Rhodohalobacter sp. 614A]